MPQSNLPLRSFLVESYDHLIEQLKKRLNSTELAHEALHDTYLRLGKAKEIEGVKRPTGYLLRIAINLARDNQRARGRLLMAAEIDTARELIDDTPSPAREAESKSDMDAIERALAKLPSRRRAILLASSKEELSPDLIAKRFGLSKRTINMELKLARELCAREVLGRVKK